MTLSRGIRSPARGLPRAIAHLVAAALAVTAISAAVWAGPLPSASAGTPPPAASPASAPAMVKFYIVPPPGNGDAQSLFTIAASTLGDGSRYMEIFSLNKGRLQPNGGRLTSPQLIEPGWILRLPADAVGPGVHFGPLPVATALAPHRPSRPGGTGSGIMITGALLVSAGVAFWLIRRRAGPALSRRPAHAGAPEPRAPDRTGCSPATRLTTSDPDPGRQRPPATGTQRPAAQLAELGRVTAYLAENLHSTPRPATAPAARPETQPGAQPAARQTTKPATRPASPVTQPPGSATRPAIPAERPARRSRQFRAMRLSVLAMTIPILFGLIAATTQLALHGYEYFVFRSAGTGATQQGPSGPAPSQPSAAEHRRPARPAQVGPRGPRPGQDREGASH
jgi:hypothetical protein